MINSKVECMLPVADMLNSVGQVRDHNLGLFLTAP